MLKRLMEIIIITYFGTIMINAQPIPNDTINTEKKGFLKRVLQYFEESNKTKPDKKLDLSFIGGPHYSNDTKLGLGLILSGLYHVGPYNPELSPSNVSLYGDITTSGSYVIGISGNTIFPEMKYRLDADVYFAHRPSRYWGIGYDAGRQDYYSEYDIQTMELKVDFLRRIVENTYLGATVNLKDTRGKKFNDIHLLNNEKSKTSAIGAGLILSYDSRDFIPNPYTGIYVKAEFIYYPKFLGSTYNFNRTSFIFRNYHKIWKGGILAFDFQSILNNGDVAWNMMAMTGDSYQMRGYYNGRYRDKNLIQTQLELRQNIYKRSGAAVWAGAGNVFPKFSEFELDQTLPTFGIGYRWEFKNRVNVRLDYGIGKGESSFYFNINEAF